MSIGPLSIVFLVNGHAYEVLLDRDGEWKGLCHLFDHESLHDPYNSDVLMSGARWNFNDETITLGDATVYDGFKQELLGPMAEAIRRALHPLVPGIGEC